MSRSLPLLLVAVLLLGCGKPDEREAVTVPISGSGLERYSGRWFNPDELQVDFAVSVPKGVVTVIVYPRLECRPLEAVASPLELTFHFQCVSERRENSLDYIPPEQGDPAALVGHHYWVVREPGPLWQAHNLVERHGLTPATMRESFMDWAAQHL